MLGIKKIQFGVRHFLKIREKVGNGIGLCISKNFVTNYLVKLDRIIICSDAITLLDLTPLILKTNNH